MIQFPDGLLGNVCKTIISHLRNLNVEIILAGDPSFGACDLPTHQAELFKVETIFHFGHSSFAFPLSTWQQRTGISIHYFPIEANVFTPFEHTIKNIIRSWGIALPSEVTGEGVQRLLDPDLIRESVIRAAQRKDIQFAIHELRQISLFSPKEKSMEDRLLTKSTSISATNQDTTRKSGVDFIKEIFQSTSELKEAMDASKKEDKKN